MRYSISDTAEYGDLTRGPQIVDDHVKQTMKDILENIQTGQFAREFVSENATGRSVFKALRDRSSAHQIEEVGGQPAGHDAVRLGREGAGPAGHVSAGARCADFS